MNVRGGNHVRERRSKTYVEYRAIGVLFELTEVGEKVRRSAIPSTTSELRASFAMTEPKGLNTLSGCICVRQSDVPCDFGICPDNLFTGRLK